MKLKMWIGNLNGIREGLVISTSKERARKAVPTSKGDFDNYWVLQSNVIDGMDVDTLYTRPSRGKPTEWVRGRCPAK